MVDGCPEVVWEVDETWCTILVSRILVFGDACKIDAQRSVGFVVEQCRLLVDAGRASDPLFRHFDPRNCFLRHAKSGLFFVN